jgi:hypothetical protein
VSDFDAEMSGKVKKAKKISFQLKETTIKQKIDANLLLLTHKVDGVPHSSLIHRYLQEVSQIQLFQRRDEWKAKKKTKIISFQQQGKNIEQKKQYIRVPSPHKVASEHHPSLICH